jgi:hypothetical protein
MSVKGLERDTGFLTGYYITLDNVSVQAKNSIARNFLMFFQIRDKRVQIVMVIYSLLTNKSLVCK